MAFWSGEKLSVELSNGLIEPFSLLNIDCASYVLKIGSEIYITPNHLNKDPDNATRKLLTDDQSFTIPSGQFGFITTDEVVAVPNNAIAFISIRASIKFQGLINISGFHVDPGYRGKITFSVFNAGPQTIHLKQGEPIFLIWYADLDRTSTKVKVPSEGPYSLDLKHISKVSGEIFSPQNLTSELRRHKEEVTNKVHYLDNKLSRLIMIAGFIAVILSSVCGKYIYDIATKPHNEISPQTSVSAGTEKEVKSE